MIGVIETGAGNIHSLINALTVCGARVKQLNAPVRLDRFSKLVLPGVGSAGHAMRQLRNRGFDEFLFKAEECGIQILGICLGMQLLFEFSEEDHTACLGLLRGRCVRLQGKERIPHMGWNQVKQIQSDPLWNGIQDNGYFYFAHSFCVLPLSKNHILGLTTYGQEFAAAVRNDSVMGFQFHPEKSQTEGLKLLRNFIALERRHS